MRSDRFIYRKGKKCTITSREPPLDSKCFIRMVTKSVAMISLREAEREFMIPSDANLIPGEILMVDSDEYLIQTIIQDQLGSTGFYGVKVNAIFTHSRLETVMDDDWNPTEVWVVKNEDVKGFEQTVTLSLRQEDPGILDTTTAILYIPSLYDVKALDRLTNEKDYQVDVVDNSFLPNISRIQVRVDERK